MVNTLRDGPSEIPRGKKDNLKRLRHAISRYDTPHIIACCGALSLVPENASRLFRIEALAHVAATLTVNSSENHITDLKLRRLFCAPRLSGAIKKAEDPFPNIFVEEVPFFGGPQLIFPGPNPGTGFEFLKLIEAVFQNEPHWPTDFVTQTYQIVRGVLVLSDLLAKRVGLKRNTLGDSSERGDVTIPEVDRFRAMRDAVTFSIDEFVSCLRGVGVDASQLVDLIISIGEFGLSDHSISNGPLVHQPIVRSGDQFIVATPQRLLCALNQLILRNIAKSNLQSLFVRFYSEAILRSAHQSLGHLRHLPIPFKPEVPPSIDGVYERFYVFDKDKILYLLLVCDTLEGFDPNRVEGIWGGPQLVSNLISRARSIRDEITHRGSIGYELFCLIVPCGVNRVHEFIINDWPDDVLCLGMTANNLETVSLVEAGDRLVLWRFARKSAHALKKARFIVFDELDLFAAYRDRKYTFSLGDQESPTKVLVKPGYAMKLKAKVANEQDWHPVLYFEHQVMVKVNTLYGTKTIPMYGMPHSPVPCVCVESLPCLVWIYPANDIDESQQDMYLDFAATVGYWVWQLSPLLDPIVGNDLRRAEMLHVRISLSPSFLKPESAYKENGDAVLATVPTKGKVLVSFNEGFGALMRLTNNEAERLLLRRLIPALIETCGAPLDLSEEFIEGIVGKIAPLGVKRMLMYSDGAYVPQMDPRDLVSHRLIQVGETEDVLDEVSDHVISTRDLKPGKLPAEVRNDILKEMVSFCFSKITELVKSLRPQGLLEFLIVLSESLIRESASQQLSLASRMKTFEDNQEIAAKLPQEIAEFSESSVACRFLIEFVAAQPPTGSRPITLAIYDRLQALAGRLMALGSTSDSIHFNLCEVGLSVSRFRRVSVSNATYVAASVMYLGGIAFSRIAEAEDIFRKYLGKRPEPADRPPEESELNKATRVEFGHSLSELVDFLNTMGDIAVDLKPTTPAIMERGRLISTLISELNWSREQVLECLALFTLCPRDSYMTPPPKTKPFDLYPWRFNREVSYLRRPLIVRERNDQTEILWGHRHLDFAKVYLVELCISTRLKAKSEEMQSLLAKFRDQAGKRFNDTVYQHLQNVPQVIVRNRVRKVNHLRSDNLGDIDVLCADLRKKTLWVIECKRLAMARTPYEMRQEIEALTVGTPKDASIMKKHEARAAWVEQHVTDFLDWLEIEPDTFWKVRPLLVVDAPSISPWLTRLPISVISIDMLRAQWPIPSKETTYDEEEPNIPEAPATGKV